MAKVLMTVDETGEKIYLDTQTGKFTHMIEEIRIIEQEYTWAEPVVEPKIVQVDTKLDRLIALHTAFAQMSQEDIDKYIEVFKTYQDARLPAGSYKCLNALYHIPKSIGQSMVCEALGLAVKHWTGNGPNKRKELTREEIKTIRMLYRNGVSTTSELSHQFNFPEKDIYKAIGLTLEEFWSLNTVETNANA